MKRFSSFIIFFAFACFVIVSYPAGGDLRAKTGGKTKPSLSVTVATPENTNELDLSFTITTNGAKVDNFFYFAFPNEGGFGVAIKKEKPAVVDGKIVWNDKMKNLADRKTTVLVVVTYGNGQTISFLTNNEMVTGNNSLPPDLFGTLTSQVTAQKKEVTAKISYTPKVGFGMAAPELFLVWPSGAVDSKVAKSTSKVVSTYEATINGLAPGNYYCFATGKVAKVGSFVGFIFSPLTTVTVGAIPK